MTTIVSNPLKDLTHRFCPNCGGLRVTRPYVGLDHLDKEDIKTVFECVACLHIIDTAMPEYSPKI